MGVLGLQVLNGMAHFFFTEDKAIAGLLFFSYLSRGCIPVCFNGLLCNKCDNLF